MKIIRNDIESVKAKLKDRGIDGEQVDKLIELDEKRREKIQLTENLKKERNEATKAIAEKKRNGEDPQAEIEDMQRVGDEITEVDTELNSLNKEIDDIAHRLPNIAHESVPVGEDEDDNVEIHRVGEPRQFDFEIKAHYDLGEDLDILDFETAGQISGARFVYYKGLGARLERAVYNFMLDEHAKEGYTEMITPYLVNSNAMFGTGQFPKFTEDTYTITNEGADLTLIPTAEVPLTNYYQNKIVDESELPIYFTAFSPSFRSEAGSAGRDTRGLVRMHQFNKVEMVKFATPENSYDELEKMTQNAENILDKLKLPYRRIVLSTGDMGFAAAKTYDIEVWLPAQDTYREISSCSNTEAFQARRAKIRYRDENGKPQLMHTLNGSGLAVGRTVAAILENYQNEDGTITIPEVLVPYMGGATVIG